MTHSLIFKVTRPVAIATVAGAALFAMPVLAQTKDQATKPPAADAATSEQGRDCRAAHRDAEGGAQDHARPGEEVERRGQGDARQRQPHGELVAEKRKIPPDKTTAVDDLRTYQEFTEARLDGLKHLTSAFKSLYNLMTPEQKKNADTVFEKYTPQQRVPKPG